MTVAPPNEVPSERFVEQMGNHFLMNLIGPNHTYFHIPTQIQEKILGYDAMLDGFKTLIIQYKRLIPNVSPFSGRIPIDTNQLRNLQTRFPQSCKPYAFIGFCTHQRYRTITPLFNAGNGSVLIDEIIYLDIHSRVLSQRRSNSKSISTKIIRSVIGSEAFTLPDLAINISGCSFGLFKSDRDKINFDNTDIDIKSLGNISMLYTKLPLKP